MDCGNTTKANKRYSRLLQALMCLWEMQLFKLAISDLPNRAWLCQVYITEFCRERSKRLKVNLQFSCGDVQGLCLSYLLLYDVRAAVTSNYSSLL